MRACGSRGRVSGTEGGSVASNWAGPYPRGRSKLAHVLNIREISKN